MLSEIKSSFNAINHGNGEFDDWLLAAGTVIIGGMFLIMIIGALPFIIMGTLLVWLIDGFWPR